MSDIFRDYSFGGWLRHIRIENELTMRDVSKRLNMDAGNYSKLENSQTKPPKSAKKVEEICKAIGNPKAAKFLKTIAFQHYLSELQNEFFNN